MRKGRNSLLIGVAVICTGMFGPVYAQQARPTAGTTYADAAGNRSAHGLSCGLLFGYDTCSIEIGSPQAAVVAPEAYQAKFVDKLAAPQVNPAPQAGAVIYADGTRSVNGLACGLVFGNDTCAIPIR